MKKFYISLLLAFCMQQVFSQNWSLTGNSGLTSSNFLGTTDARDLIFKTNNVERGRLFSAGFWRFGSTVSYARIDTGGNLSFRGNGAYLVDGNKYAFQYINNPKYGLFFNSTKVQYEFRNGNAVP